jgi:nucleoid-associated protein YgaU
MWAVVAATAAWLVISTVIPSTLRALVVAGHAIRPLSRPIATVVAAILLVGMVRIPPGGATVPPPSARVIVEEERTPVSLAVRNPVSEAVSSTGAGSVYTVMSGDTLWGIAKHILGGGGTQPTGAEIASGWKSIYAANPDVVGDDPNLILPGQVLKIPGGIHG